MNRIMKISEFDDAVYYRASCCCGDPACDLTLELEKDVESRVIFLNMYKKFRWSVYDIDNNFFKVFWSKIKTIFKILFLGYMETEECFIFEGEEQIVSFLNSLKEGMYKLKGEEGA
jgi:hypothetical protein